MIKDPEKYRDQRVVISGGGDSALDWSIFLADVAKEVYLVHRRTGFRGALDSVEKVMKLAETGKIKLVTNAEVDELQGTEKLNKVGISIKGDDSKTFIDAEYFIPLFGLKPTLGPIGDWGLALEKDSIVVDTSDYSTNLEGVYAIGDINTYHGKLKLILCGFHEGTLMVQSAFKRIYPDKNLVLKYPIKSIEDPFAEDDWKAWSIITKEIGKNVQIVGDDLFVTNKNRLLTGIENNSANSILIKLNQIGTLSETIETIELAKNSQFGVIVSHRSGETEDVFISDLSVGLNAGQIKTGSVSRTDRTAKYNQLIRIEEMLGSDAKYFGKGFFDV